MFRYHLDEVISLYTEVPFRLKLEEGGATVGGSGKRRLGVHVLQAVRLRLRGRWERQEVGAEQAGPATPWK